MKKIVIFASGSGSNAENIIKHFNKTGTAKVEAIFSDRPKAFVHVRAQNLGVPSYTFTKADFYNGANSLVRELLGDINPDLIVLAGFLLLFPSDLIKIYDGKIINIHPSLLPKFGGKGMYGENVHKAVIESGELESGISIHEVNEKFDEGKILFQAKVPVNSDDSPETLAAKIHLLEQEHFPQVIERLLI